MICFDDNVPPFVDLFRRSPTVAVGLPGDYTELDVQKLIQRGSTWPPVNLHSSTLVIILIIFY